MDERTGMPRIPSSRGVPNPAPALKELIQKHASIPGPEWTEFCDLINMNHDLKLLLAEQEIKIRRHKEGERLYRDCHHAVVARLHFVDPPTDF